MKERIYLCSGLTVFVIICALISISLFKGVAPEDVSTPTDISTATDISSPTDAPATSTDISASVSSQSGSSSPEITTTVEKCKHKFKSATCTKAKYCTVCKKSYGKPLGHKWENATCLKLKTCKVCKLAVGVKGEHSYKNGSCVLCDAKDPNFGALTAHEWQLFKSSKLIIISFKNGVFSESKMLDMSTVTDSEAEDIYSNGSEENMYRFGKKYWYAIDGRGLSMSYLEEKNKITIVISDMDDTSENGKEIVLTRIGKTKLKVTKCTLKGKYWNIRVGDVLTAVID